MAKPPFYTHYSLLERLKVGVHQGTSGFLIQRHVCSKDADLFSLVLLCNCDFLRLGGPSTTEKRLTFFIESIDEFWTTEVTDRFQRWIPFVSRCLTIWKTTSIGWDAQDGLASRDAKVLGFE